MKHRVCAVCGAKLKKNGFTSAGRQRWRCTSCGGSSVVRYSTDRADLEAFLGWLLGKETMRSMPGGGRGFRRRTERFWRIWPMPEFVDEVHRVVFVDGIYLARDLVVLIARSEGHVLSWHMARAETKAAWSALLSKIAPPEMVVTDGGSGFAGAVAEVWPQTRVQRCLWHAFSQVNRHTTSRPRLRAGIELRGLAVDLMHVETLREAEQWRDRFMEWCAFWSDFLEEKTYVDGRAEYTHERLRAARRGLATLLNRDLLFTYLRPELAAEAPMPRHNNHSESTNRQLRDLMRNHQGMPLDHRIKAVYWWCYMHTEHPLPPDLILERMPTDDDIDVLKAVYGPKARGREPVEWDAGLTWSEFHHSTPYPYSVD